MVRKSASSRSTKASSSLGSIFEVKFDVVLIIVLIIVAILLVCFINKKFSREQFYVSMIKEHMYAEGNPSTQTQNQNQNRLPDYYEGFDLTGSNLPTNLSKLNGKHVFILLGPSWCGHSKNFLKHRFNNFVKAFKNIDKKHHLHAIDVDIKGTAIIDEIKVKSKVNALPSLFLFENGKFVKAQLHVEQAVKFVKEA